MALPAPPLPGDGAFFIDFEVGMMGWTRGLKYSMNDLALFQRALRQRTDDGPRAYQHNQDLAQHGDGVAREMCRAQWREAGDSKRDFHDFYEGRASTEEFLSYVADSQELSLYILRAGNGPSTFTNHEKADVVEASIGAVDQDCNGAVDVMKEVLRGFGICYPMTDEEVDEMERVWELARRALAEQTAAVLEARRAAEAEAKAKAAYEAWRLWCWQQYWAQGGR
ncbi:hypothetical protein CLAFUW4_04196 [Fulvia fulva]|nr:hypothetical protein CLAFUR4_04182 [Fulvia fulva]WPV14244.1 hypothetical protein CLAFUW4_04196 [Fulvia fulva]WPV28390.1 hypothetical protein CLAFUW7_04185 [Fulvia fulva]